MMQFQRVLLIVLTVTVTMAVSAFMPQMAPAAPSNFRIMTPDTTVELAHVRADGSLEVPGERILARAKVTAADHEVADGYFVLDFVTLAVPKGSANQMFLREAVYAKQDYELVLRPVVRVKLGF